MASSSSGVEGSGSLPLPGQVVYYDYRESVAQSSSNGPASTSSSIENPSSSSSQQPRRPLRLVSFNVERGYELARVTSLLKRLDPDIVALQECDWGCERSRSADVCREIAKELKFAAAFAAEFEELDSPARLARDAGGGVHGNAVLCRWGFAGSGRGEGGGEGAAFAVPHTVAYDWEREPPAGPASSEPRRGGRVALGAACLVPLEKLGLDDGDDGGDGVGGRNRQGEFAVVLAYSLHLECFCGASGRALQLGDVLRDAEERLPRLSRELEQKRRRSESCLVPLQPRSSHPPPPPPPRLFCSILGDLNTLAHGIVRLSPLRARGRARWASLGRTEAAWLHRQVLLSSSSPTRERERGKIDLFFECPFPLDTVTFDNPSYHFLGGRLRLVRGKLDWALLLKKERRGEKSRGRRTTTAATATTGREDDEETRAAALSPASSSCCYGGLRALSATTANDDFSASDHKALVVDVVAE